MNLLVWGVLWSICGWLVGILAYFTWGLLTLASPNDTVRNTAANYYSKQAMKLLGRAALVERGTSWDIYSTSHDADKNVDEITIDGNTGHISNDTGLLSTLHKKPFGLVPPPEENAASYVSPELGELGRVDVELEEQNHLKTSDGDYREYVTLDDRRPLVQLREYARRMVHGCRGMWDVDETVDLYKQSQSGFGSPKTQQFMILIIAYSASAVLAWLILTNAGGAAPTGVSVPGI
jgi:hypothetical protein